MRLSELQHRGQSLEDFGRVVMAHGAAKALNVDVRDFARNRLQDHVLADEAFAASGTESGVITKTGVGANTWGTRFGTIIATDIVRESIAGRVPAARRWPLFAGGATAGLTGVGASFRKLSGAIPVSSIDLGAMASITPCAVSAMVVGTREFWEDSADDASLASAIAELLRSEVIRKWDSVFASDDAAVANVSPAGILYAAQSVSSTGVTPAAIIVDIGSMFALKEGANLALDSEVFIVSPKARANLAMAKLLDADGRLAGFPVVSGAPTGTVAMVTAHHLHLSYSDDVRVSATNEGLIEQDTAPAGVGSVPTAASATLISLMQDDLTAVKATISVGWSVGGPTDSSGNFAVVTLASATWA
jgi:hypothetical protein